MKTWLYTLYDQVFKNELFWKRCSFVGAGLLLFQIVYFTVLYIPELKDRWTDLKPLLGKGVSLLIGLLFLLLIYFKIVPEKGSLKKWTSLIYRLALSLYLLQWFFMFIYWFINPPLTFTQIGSIVSGYGCKRDYVSYSQISPHMKLAVLASEDQLFPDHDGFDIKAIKLALKYNKKHPRKTKGASTISQQTAKNIFLWQKRNFIRKGLEVYFTFMIELFWNKKTILERYLNVLETGPGIFGVQAAAKHYFNKNASELSRSEAAMIAACLPNPKKYTVKPMSAHVRSRYDDIMQQMNNIEPDEDIRVLISQ